jgi:hypothetical protein
VLAPATTDAGDTTSDNTATGITVKVALLLTPPYPADTVTTSEADTAIVVTVNLAEVAPPGTVTVVGTEADVDELCSVTIAPPTGAGPLSVTLLAVVLPPATTDVGDRITDETV